MIRFFAFVFCFFIATDGFACITLSPKQQDEFAVDMFNNNDKNKDGSITLEEFSPYTEISNEDKLKLSTLFKDIDKNQDGKIDIMEYKARYGFNEHEHNDKYVYLGVGGLLAGVLFKLNSIRNRRRIEV